MSNKETKACRTYITWADGKRTSLADYVKGVEAGKAMPCCGGEGDPNKASVPYIRIEVPDYNHDQVKRLHDSIDAAIARQDEDTAKRKAAAKLYDAFINPYPFHSRDWHMVEAKRRGDAMRADAARWATGGLTGRPPHVAAVTVNVKDEFAKAEGTRIPVEARSVTVTAEDVAKARGLTPEQHNKGEKVIHARVAYHFEGGKVIGLDNVTRVVMSGTWMRVWSDVGLTIIDVSKLLHSTSLHKNKCPAFPASILEKSRKVIFSNGKQLNLRNVTEIDVTHPDFWFIQHDEGVSNVYTAKVDAVTVGV